MKHDPTTAFREELARMRPHLAKKNGAPTRFQARVLLCALGEIILEAGNETAEPLALELQAVVAKKGDEWQRAVREELELACTEHIQGVDPRFLKHPRYDLTYTLSARRKLEMRLRAVDLLGLTVDERLLDQVVEADERLQPHLKDT
jgi:hypothetical protein